MNTNIFNSHLDERLEGEDTADALFAALMIEPPAALNSKILELAHQAIELQEFERLELAADALFTSLMVEPPPELDKRILDMAHKAIEDEYFEKAKPVTDTAQKPINTVFTNLCGVIEDILIDLFGAPEVMAAFCAADAEEQTDLELLLRRPDGDCTLYTTVDQEDPSRRSVMLFFDGEGYEGKEVLLTKGNTVILHGTIKYGQIEAPIPVGVKIEPPFDLRFS